MLRTLFLFLLCGMLCAADLPTAAQKAMDKATMEIAKVRMALVKDLTKAQEVATKKGDLDGAIAIKEEIERQTKELETAADLLGNPRTPGKKPWASGSWEIVWGGFRSTVTFEDDGVVKRSDGVSGKYTLANDEAATITWDSDKLSGGITWTIQAPEKGNSEVASGRNAFGTPFKATKQ